MDSGFHVQDSRVGLRIPIVREIPDSVSCVLIQLLLVPLNSEKTINYERARKFTDKFYIDKDVIDRSCTRVHVYLGKRISSNGNVNVSLEY